MDNPAKAENLCSSSQKVSTDVALSAPSALVNDGQAFLRLEMGSPLSLPAELYGIIADYLVLKSAFGTCASLDVASKATHFHVKPVLWRLVAVKCQQDAPPSGSADPARKEMMNAGNGYIRHIAEFPPKGEWLEKRLAVEAYQSLAPRATTLVTIVRREDAFSEGEWTILIASLMPDTQVHSGDLLDVEQVLTMFAGLAKSGQPPRITTSLTISIPLNKLLFPGQEERSAVLRPATESGISPIRRISVEDQSIDTPTFENYLALFRSLEPLLRDKSEHTPSESSLHSGRQVRIEVKEDDVSELQIVFKAWSAFVLQHQHLVDVALEVQLRQTSTLILPSEDDTDAHLRGLFTPLLTSRDMLGLWGDPSHDDIGEIYLCAPEASAGLVFGRSADAREITVQFDVYDYIHSPDMGGTSGWCKVSWNTSEMVSIRGWP